MDRCVACGAGLGVGRFCLNCGHRIGAPPPAPAARPTAAPAPRRPAQVPPARTRPSSTTRKAAEHPPVAPPVQAADPTPVPPTAAPGPTAPTDTGADAPVEPASAAPVEPPPPRPEWDPREDLLPYEEVDDLDSEAPIRGRAWIAWVAGAVLLLGLVIVLLQVYGSDSGDAATDRSEGDSTGAGPGSGDGAETAGGTDESQDAERAETSRGAGPVTGLLSGATFDVPGTASPTTDLDGSLVAYEAGQMGDGDPATAWRTEGDASGRTITITLRQPGVVSRVGLVNGYAKRVAGVDWYPHNRRILAATWGFDDGTTVEQTFAERPAMQRLEVPPVETATVTLTVTSVTPPGAGELGRDYTAISEVAITGRRAG